MVLNILIIFYGVVACAAKDSPGKPDGCFDGDSSHQCSVPEEDSTNLLQTHTEVVYRNLAMTAATGQEHEKEKPQRTGQQHEKDVYEKKQETGQQHEKEKEGEGEGAGSLVDTSSHDDDIGSHEETPSDDIAALDVAAAGTDDIPSQPDLLEPEDVSEIQAEYPAAKSFSFGYLPQVAIQTPYGQTHPVAGADTPECGFTVKKMVSKRKALMCAINGIINHAQGNNLKNVYLGCFKDQSHPRNLPTKLGSQSHTMMTCSAKCEGGGYKFYGLQYYGECWCGNDFPDKYLKSITDGKWRDYDVVKDALPDSACGGKPDKGNKRMGRAWTMQIFAIKKKDKVMTDDRRRRAVKVKYERTMAGGGGGMGGGFR